MGPVDLVLADHEWFHEELYIAWRAASAEADLAFTAWQRLRDRYAVYVAATDQADAVAMALAAEHARAAAQFCCVTHRYSVALSLSSSLEFGLDSRDSE